MIVVIVIIEFRQFSPGFLWSNTTPRRTHGE